MSTPAESTPTKPRSKRLSLASFMPKLDGQSMGEAEAPEHAPPSSEPPSDPLPCLQSASTQVYPSVDLSGCQLTNLELLADSAHITHLTVSDNPLKCLDTLGVFNNLQFLDIQRCGLSSLNLSLDRLVRLDASNNSLTRVDLQCPSLKQLSLDNNTITELAPAPSVEELSICNNYSVLNFSGWNALSTLYCTGNSRISGLTSRTLRVCSWDGSSLADSRGLCNARILLYSGPRFPEFSTGTHPLQHLALTGIGLDSLPQWLPRRFPCLQVLDLSDNCLEESCLDTISSMSSLKGLSLASNQMQDLGMVYEELRSLYQLGVLDLRNNPVMQGVEGATFAHYFRVLKGLGLWWLDGHQIAQCPESGYWNDSVAIGLASIQCTGEIWAPVIEHVEPVERVLEPTNLSRLEPPNLSHLDIDMQAEWIIRTCEQKWRSINRQLESAIIGLR